MIDLSLSCPDVTWPRRLNGFVVLGIALAHDGPIAWIVFHAADGTLLSTSGFICDGTDFPDQALDQPVVIQASADRTVWKTLGNPNSSVFFDSVRTGAVHISGDFRVFAKNAPLLIKMLERSGIWDQIDGVLLSLGLSHLGD